MTIIAKTDPNNNNIPTIASVNANLKTGQCLLIELIKLNARTQAKDLLRNSEKNTYGSVYEQNGIKFTFLNYYEDEFKNAFIATMKFQDAELIALILDRMPAQKKKEMYKDSDYLLNAFEYAPPAITKILRDNGFNFSDLVYDKDAQRGFLLVNSLYEKATPENKTQFRFFDELANMRPTLFRGTIAATRINKVTHNGKPSDMTTLLRFYNKLSPTPSSETPLHFSDLSDDDFNTILHAEIFDFEQKDKDGNTPLHIALQSKNFTRARTLLDIGADFQIQNNQGETPYTLAVVSGDPIFKEMQKPTTSVSGWSFSAFIDTAKNLIG